MFFLNEFRRLSLHITNSSETFILIKMSFTTLSNYYPTLILYLIHATPIGRVCKLRIFPFFTEKEWRKRNMKFKATRYISNKWEIPLFRAHRGKFLFISQFYFLFFIKKNNKKKYSFFCLFVTVSESTKQRTSRAEIEKRN